MWEVSGSVDIMKTVVVFSSFLDLCFWHLCVHGEYDSCCWSIFSEHISWTHFWYEGLTVPHTLPLLQSRGVHVEWSQFPFIFLLKYLTLEENVYIYICFRNLFVVFRWVDFYSFIHFYYFFLLNDLFILENQAKLY